MRNELRVLFLEDSESDAELLLRELERGSYQVIWRRVQDAAGTRAALRDEKWDLVVSDYSMPGFGAEDALAIVREAELDLPFIIVSGTIGEETAVEALRAGADDFLLKDRLTRFLPAVARELREAETRRARRQAERSLRESESRYRRIVETAHEGIWTADANGQTTYANRRLLEMLGCQAADLATRSLLDFIEPSQSASGPARDAPTAPTTALKPEIVRFVRKDGRTISCLLSVASIRGDEGGHAGMVAMITDVTEQQRLQAQVMESDRMASVGMLAAGVAHEINNPLFALLGNLDLAVGAAEQGPTPAGAELLRMLRDAREAAARLRDIARDLRVFSHASDPEKTENVALGPVLESCLRMADNEIRHRARLVTELAQVPAVRANESRLAQVFLNLVVNAAQAIPEGAAEKNCIRVSLRQKSDGLVLVEISDTGSGMDETTLGRLFTPFFTTKPKGVGTGLGLSISQRIVRSLGGRIEVESRPGEGTTFRVALPAAPAAEESRPERPKSGGGPASRRGRILIVDDEPALGRLLGRMLEKAHDVMVTTSGHTALEKLRAGARFDVVVCDLMMPDLSGVELYDRIKELASDQAERMVFMTGGAFTERARDFLTRVGNPCIEKPFDPQELRALIAGML